MLAVVAGRDLSGDAAIILEGATPDRGDAFAAFYKLEELLRVRDHVFRGSMRWRSDHATVYTVDQVSADPMQLNSRLGTYTNFVNLLDLWRARVPHRCAPTARRRASRSCACGQRTRRSRRSACVPCDTNLPLGATGRAQPPLADVSGRSARTRSRLRSWAHTFSGMRSMANCARSMRASWPRRDDRRLSALRSRHQPAEARHAAGRGREGAAIVVEVWADIGGSVRPFRRRRSAAASRSNGAPCWRRHGKRFPGRGAGGRRRAIFALRRLARLHSG